jgi:hypothetical protein
MKRGGEHVRGSSGARRGVGARGRSTAVSAEAKHAQQRKPKELTFSVAVHLSHNCPPSAARATSDALATSEESLRSKRASSAAQGRLARLGASR